MPYIDSPFPSLKLAESGASKIVLRGWKYGVEKYHSVIFVHRDSDIEDNDVIIKPFKLEDLEQCLRKWMPMRKLLSLAFTDSGMPG